MVRMIKGRKPPGSEGIYTMILLAAMTDSLWLLRAWYGVISSNTYRICISASFQLEPLSPVDQMPITSVLGMGSWRCMYLSLRESDEILHRSTSPTPKAQWIAVGSAEVVN